MRTTSWVAPGSRRPDPVGRVEPATVRLVGRSRPGSIVGTGDGPSTTWEPSTTGRGADAVSTPLELVRLDALMARSIGRATVRIGLIDGPVAPGHPDLEGAAIRELAGAPAMDCVRSESFACAHGTFVAGMLVARRGSPAPAICPECTLLVRPIFGEARLGDGQVPAASPEELAAAIAECTDAGAHVINLSAALVPASCRSEALDKALDYASRRGAIIVAAAGNEGTVGGSAITRHPWVIPVVASDLRGRPLRDSNLGRSIGAGGLRAPGDAITGLGTSEVPVTFGGTSVATPFVTGAIALLLSEFPAATAAQVRFSINRPEAPRRAALVPPLLDASSAYRFLMSVSRRMEVS